MDNPAALDRYIAACQIGITLSSLVLGAYAQATFAVWLAPWLAQLGGLQPLAAQSTAAAIVLLVLTAAQVIFGELVPKSLALQYPTPSALYTLPPMVASLWIYRPFIALAERQRAVSAAAARRADAGAPPHPLARRDRAADRREPRRRPAGARRAPSACSARCG